MGRGSNRAFENEIIHNVCSAFDELHKGFGVDEVRTFFEQVLGPLYKNSSNCASVEGFLALYSDLIDLRTCQDITSQNLLHVCFECIFLLDCSFQKEIDILINSLIVHVSWVRKRQSVKIIQEVHVCLSAGYVWKLHFLPPASSLRVPIFQFFEDVEKCVIWGWNIGV